MDGTAVSTALTTVWSVVNGCVEFITGNAVLMVIFVAGLVPIGFKIFRKAKNSVR